MKLKMTIICGLLGFCCVAFALENVKKYEIPIKQGSGLKYLF